MFPPTPSPGSTKPLLGVVEWYCYHVNFGVTPTPDYVSDCIDAHLAAGFDHLVWAAGRGTLDYHSVNPRNTLLGEFGSLFGNEDWSQIIALTRTDCLLRRAIRLCRERGVGLWARLCMNRFYGWPGYDGLQSRFARDNPGFWEAGRTGATDASRLCYAFEEVQEERLDILTEVQEIGVDALVPDFCRQPPITRYHPRWVQLFLKAGGQDPLSWADPTPERLEPWFRFRAGVMTGFMRELRKRVRRGEERTGKACPIVPRIAATSPTANLACGLDVETWLQEDLVDGIMLSPLVFCPQATEMAFHEYVELAHRFGKTCIGGLGSYELIRNHVPTNTGYFRPEPMYRLLERQYVAGVDAMSVYQSESLVRMDWLRDHLRAAGNPATVKRRAVGDAGDEVSPSLGYDWHTLTEGRKGFDLASSGERAL